MYCKLHLAHYVYIYSAGELAEAAKEFEVKATAVRKKYWWENKKMKLILGGVAVSILIIIIIVIAVQFG